MRVLGRSRRGSAFGAVSIGILIFALATLLTLSACGSDEPTATAVPEPTATSAPEPTATSAPDPTPEPTEEPTAEPEPTEAPAARTEPVELFDMDVRNIDAWINSEPTSIAQLTSEGKVVLVDFWTYTCVNCLRTLPFLREWQDKYADNGLVILGVHAPEFEFEKELENVQMSVDEEGIEWPVALDNEMSTWRSFNNRYWPAKYLIDTNGDVRYTHFGEGAYRETELEIRHVLEESGYDVSGIPIGEVENTSRDDTARSVTRELYGGYDRNYSVYGLYAAQDEYYVGPDREVEYEDIYAERNSYPPQKFVLSGLWRNEQEAIVHARETMDLSDYIALRFHGRSANVVIDPPEPDEFKVYVELDGRWLMENEAGDDILFDDEGRSYFNVDEGRMYKIVETPEYVEDTLKLSSDSPNFAIFAFTFGTYDGGF
ncbi:MAG: redoxin domain-containing protein [Chloroflexi bacterium]|nr:redoxin domain-containing protein [Chloroflexota bacterium]MYF79486.1 redoxin domain-containing protein [Chloroflexota bacterium]MYK61801.1 redoxin domain-containing protein [Chloroflexota bacterium]